MADRTDVDTMMALIRDLFPVCRSITGDGVRETLARMQRELSISMHEVASGTPVFDWTVPNEWNARSAWIEGPDGNRIVDFSDNNLHLVNYSIAVDETMPLAELQKHLHSLDDHPDWIPYRTSYYNENWGFCLTSRQRKTLQDGQYRVMIDADLKPGHLTYGETVIQGASDDEVLVYSHLCHPSLANDNLSGLAVSLMWARHLSEQANLRYTYRFVWGPGTIGSITWLALNEANLKRVKHGLVTVLLGRSDEFRYKRSRGGNAEIDRIAEFVLGDRAQIRDFEPYGYDERQFCSPGINLAVGRLTRAPNGEYAEYHTSADNLELIDEDALSEALDVCKQIGAVLETNRSYRNQFPKGEPQLGKRGLYRNTGGDNPKLREQAMLWILNFSDGDHALVDIAKRSAIPYDVIHNTALELEEAGLLA